VDSFEYIEMDLKECSVRTRPGLYDSGQRSVVACYGRGNVLSGSIKDGRHFTW
jgi:hypothetical protein